MKIDQLRKIIREEIKTAFREELQEVLTEAVKIASEPVIEKPSVAVKKPSKQELAELIGIKTPPKSTNVEFTKDSGINEMLKQTQANMTSEEYKQVFNGTSDMVQKPNFASAMANQMGMSNAQPGVDISKLDFVSKAKSIYDASIKKDKQKLGQL